MKYTVIYEKGPTSWGAYVPDLPGVVAVGDTRDEAEQLIHEAVEMHLEAMREEGLPGLIVQASMLSFMMSEMCRTRITSRALKVFNPRTLHPVYDTGPFTIHGAPSEDERSASLWVIDPNGGVAMTASAEYA